MSEHMLQAMELAWGKKADFHNQFRSRSFTEFVSLGKLCLMNSLNPPLFLREQSQV
jgi:hypothetical protein